MAEKQEKLEEMSAPYNSTDNLNPDGKHPGGRSPFFKTPEELQVKINEYFAGGYRKRKTIVGNKKEGYREIEIPDITISDLVIFLGFCDRQSFYDLEKRKEFTHTIKRARTFIEREYESLLKDGNPAGAIFALKNFGWIDRQDHAVTGDQTLHVVYDQSPTPDGDEKSGAQGD